MNGVQGQRAAGRVDEAVIEVGGASMRGAAIDGATRLYAIVGDPVAQVRSPGVYTEAFARAGHNAVLIPALVRADRFDETIRGLMALGNLDGLLVTAPYKARMVPFAARLSARASVVGAVNALRRERDGSWSGDMFDGVGFVAAARRIAPLAGRRALLFGCGGAGAAIAAGLAADGVAALTLVDPDATRAQRLATELARHYPQCEVRAGRGDHDEPGHDVVVNASTVGMRDGDPLPGEPGSIDARCLVGDVVLRPAGSPTALVARALAAGARVVTGQDMHAGQREAILDFFAPALAAGASSTRKQEAG
ncbi:shikimate dehydrogenase family protein [Burkholderia gladioli]|uniref:shikimate dehydrogenase family protein n=1 Tax=Burkholderia gladioli TaxID=28095 RepID=UPI00163EA04C|nr:shikimate dehydrogenase [Burkholderia gladioli]